MFPFPVPDLGTALKLAYAVVVGELLAIALIRSRFMGGRLGKHHRPGRRGAVVFTIGVWLGRIGAS
jgi:hypothetical protein